jgi:hypothetical protein
MHGSGMRPEGRDRSAGVVRAALRPSTAKTGSSYGNARFDAEALVEDDPGHVGGLGRGDDYLAQLQKLLLIQ